MIYLAGQVKYSFRMIALLLSTLLSSAHATSCPNLSGSYYCMNQSNEYLKFTVQQKIISASGEPEKVEYTFDYPTIPGDPDVVNASTTGEMDSMGWLTKCSKQRLIAIPVDGSMMSEIYLDSRLHLIRTMNGSVVQDCAKTHS